ncbi:DUF3870 domain-containing protein [Micromonospora sp. WMMD558]|uniref:DUF3870 domain-containing protein n=1 Tax=Micromonospora sp. WMMD558 TaxID=3403462 RepID=UPI003BF60E01
MGLVETVLVTGYSAAPRGTSMHARYEHCGVVLEVDPRTDVVVAAEFTVITGLANDFLRRLVVGYDLSQGIAGLAALIKSRYLAPSSDAMVVALRGAVQRYSDHKVTQATT